MTEEREKEDGSSVSNLFKNARISRNKLPPITTDSAMRATGMPQAPYSPVIKNMEGFSSIVDSHIAPPPTGSTARNTVTLGDNMTN